MSTLMRLWIVVIAFTSCAKFEDTPSETLELGEFEVYVHRFEQSAAAFKRPVKVTNLIIKFGKMTNPRENGVCNIVGDETPVILINQEIWKRMGERDHEALIFHELGHCVLRRKHVEARLDNGLPSSMMNPYRLNSDTYMAYEKYYLKELFDGRSDF